MKYVAFVRCKQMFFCGALQRVQRWIDPHGALARTSGSIHMDRYTLEHALDRDIAPGGVFVSSSVCSSHAGNASKPMNVKSCTFRHLVGQGV